MAQVSTVLGVAMPEERAQAQWTEGVAIWVAVIVVSLVGEWLHPALSPPPAVLAPSCQLLSTMHAMLTSWHLHQLLSTQL